MNSKSNEEVGPERKKKWLDKMIAFVESVMFHSQWPSIARSKHPTYSNLNRFSPNRSSDIKKKSYLIFIESIPSVNMDYSHFIFVLNSKKMWKEKEKSTLFI